jgi:hypothetical protein
MACAPQARSEAGVGHIEGGELVGAEERSGGAGQGVLKGGGGALKGGGGGERIGEARRRGVRQRALGLRAHWHLLLGTAHLVWRAYP